MSVQPVTNSKSDAGPTENKLQRTSVGNRAEDGLSASGRNETKAPKGQKEKEQSKAVKRGRESTGETASVAKRQQSSESISDTAGASKTTKEYNSHNWPRFLVVEACQNGERLTRISPFAISKAIKGSAGDAKTIKKMRAGTLLVEVEKRQHSKGLLNMKTLAGTPVKVSPHRSLNSSKGVIRSWDLVGTSEKEITDELSEIGVTEVNHIKIKRNGAIIETSTFVLAFDQPTPPTTIKCGYLNIKVEDYIPTPMRCYTCQKFGHKSNKCSSQPSCGICSQKGHPTEGCKKAPHCTNCAGDHPAFSKKCPRFIEEKEIQTICIKQKISFPEARKMVKYTKPSGPSFTAVVSRCQCKCTCQKQTGSNGQTPPPPVPEVPNPSGSQTHSHPKTSGSSQNQMPSDSKKDPSPSGSTQAPNQISIGLKLAEIRATDEQADLTSSSNEPGPSGLQQQQLVPGGQTLPAPANKDPTKSKDQAPRRPTTSFLPIPVAQTSFSGKASSPPPPKDPPKKETQANLNVRRRFGRHLQGNKTTLAHGRKEGPSSPTQRKLIDRINLDNKFSALRDEHGTK